MAFLQAQYGTIPSHITLGCRNEIIDLSLEEELARDIARITYANGGDYKEETLAKYARAYIDINR